MKKLKTFIDDEEVAVEIDKKQITMDGHVLKILKSDRLGTLVELDGKEIMVDDIVELPEEGIFRIEINGYTLDVKVVDPISEALASGAGTSGEIFSPMSGTISSINVEVGQEINEGGVLVVISAMKMENQITSPVDGVVRDIKVLNDEQVPSGKLLVIVEPKE